MNIDYRYYLSRDVSLDVRFKISLLDLTHSAVSFDAAVTSEMSVTAQIYTDGLPMHTVPIRSHSPSQMAYGAVALAGKKKVFMPTSVRTSPSMDSV